ncbi:MAG: hypothetical protein E3J35_11095 [Methanomassiliicoccales archaeon]|nr:MAG: hypothetical protein E3J35_11095 [Methanomassiliicoccales archaeon]
MIVTVDRLKKAVAKKFDLEEPEAGEMAERVLSYFGFTNVIIDNVLNPEDRRLFYKLNDVGLLHTYAERLMLPSGKTWRIFYWEMSDNEIARVLKKKKAAKKTTYSSLPSEYWASLSA